jgi:hypothetical protein
VTNRTSGCHTEQSGPKETHPCAPKQKSTRQDNDRDGPNNLGEFETGNNPRDDDTDNDGIEDGDENAGVIESFDPATGKLVITLAPNGRIEGKVDGTTEIECENPPQATPRPTLRHDGDDDRGDDDEDCTTAALVKGAKVEEAELRGNGVFDEIEIGS